MSRSGYYESRRQMLMKAKPNKDTDCVCRQLAALGEPCEFCKGARVFSPKILFPDSESKPPFVDVVPIAFLDISHPTISSGPAQDSELRLTAIPAEIRAKIYPYLLTKEEHNGPASTTTQNQVHVTANEKCICWCPKGVRCQYLDVWSSPTAPGRCSAVGPPGITSILEVCKQLYNEAVNILCSQNSFVIEDESEFQKYFVGHPRRGIGNANCRLITHISCFIPKKNEGIIYADCYRSLCTADDSDFVSTLDERTDVEDTDEDADE